MSCDIHILTISMRVGLFALLLLCLGVGCLDNGQALTPPLMLTTDSLGCDTNQLTVRNYAKYLNQTGLRQKGYQLLLIRDCWQVRDQQGQLKPDPKKFLVDMGDLVTELHQMGLKVGLGTDVGPVTRLGKPGLMGHEASDIETMAEWGIDYIWVDNHQPVTGTRARFLAITRLIEATQRPIAIGINNEGREGVAGWGGAMANTWRVGPTAAPSWKELQATITRQDGLEKYAGQGAWNDAGSLTLSRELSLSEFTLQLVMWVGLKSPLSIPSIEIPADRATLLLNDELISLHQDPLKRQGRLVRRDVYSSGTQDVWATPLSNGRLLVVFVNGLNKEADLEINLNTEARLGPVGAYAVRDPVARRTLGSSSSEVLRVRGVGRQGVAARVVTL